MKYNLAGNKFLDELQKLAMFGSEEAENNAVQEPMNPDTAPEMKQADADAESAKDQNDKEAELQKAKDDITNAKEASDEHDALYEKIANALPEFGVLARLYDWAQGGSDVSEQVYKEASSILDEMLTDEEKYIEHMTRVANELFASEENQNELYSEEGMQFVFDKLADFLDNEDLQKVAAEDGSFMGKVMGSMGDFVNSVGKFFKDVKDLPENKSALEAALATDKATAFELKGERNELGINTPRGMELMDNLEHSLAPELANSVRNGRIGRGLGAGALAGGALYGGHKLYQGLHSENDDEQLAASEDKGLLSKIAGGTLMEEYRSETGGMAKMSKRALVNDFLKIAGAAALISAANDKTIKEEFRKEAEQVFDEIAVLGRKQMDAAFIKVATDIYSEQELHEIVAGKHTDTLFSKVAFFVEANEWSADELEKRAGASGVATKGVGGALSDAKSNIEEFIGTAKANAEGPGREYIGVVKGAEGKGDNKGPAGTGTPGGQIITNSMAGYKVINNPGEYDVEQTAAMLEEAVLAKQAAYDTFNRADDFIKKFSGAVHGK